MFHECGNINLLTVDNTRMSSTASLTFKLPEEQDSFDLAVKGSAFHSVLWDLDQHLRGRLKYEELDEHVRYALQDVRDRLYDLMGEYDARL